MFLCVTLFFFFFSCGTPVWVAYSAIRSPANGTLSPLFTGCHRNAVSHGSPDCDLGVGVRPRSSQLCGESAGTFYLQGEASLTFYTADRPSGKV